MKLIIQIPCFNEAETLPETLATLPREVPGCDCVEWLIIDDGCVDNTVEVAQQHGVDHVVRFPQNRGLARAFEAGLAACLEHGADIVVNTDGDNQYDASCIPDLVAPIVRGEADVVLGDRPIETIREFSWLKKRLQRLGSKTVRWLSGADLPDATTGFRAFSREAALQLNVLSEFSYTLETLFQIGNTRMAVTHVPIRTNRKTRPSRLFGSMLQYLTRSLKIITRVYTMHRPLRVFTLVGGVAGLLGLILAVRYVLLACVFGEGKGHIQSVIIAALLLNVAVLVWLLGLMADTIRANRLLIERVLYRVRRMELAQRKDAGKPKCQGDNVIR
jgi:glycosyltransferase involved in cell wall biosynthesis